MQSIALRKCSSRRLLAPALAAATGVHLLQGRMAAQPPLVGTRARVELTLGAKVFEDDEGYSSSSRSASSAESGDEVRNSSGDEPECAWEQVGKAPECDSANGCKWRRAEENRAPKWVGTG